jgi:hypothetical protein
MYAKMKGVVFLSFGDLAEVDELLGSLASGSGFGSAFASHMASAQSLLFT